MYKEIVTETLAFIEREMTTVNGAFYSSYDADSDTSEGELEEGAFYVWQKEELKLLLNEDYDLFADYYNINNYGIWEDKNYVLIRKDNENKTLKKHNITLEALKKRNQSGRKILFDVREERPKPRLDDKSLTSWNAIMLKGYLDAYRVFKNEAYIEAAKKNATFILNNQLREDGGLNHNYKDGKSTINGYLEDYGATIDAFIALYENTLDEKWLFASRDLTNYAFDYFFDDISKMFYFTSHEDDDLVTRNIEYRDNVIPASNSMMAKNLFKLSHYFENEHYLKTATTMLIM